jgi:hypothetical protein
MAKAFQKKWKVEAEEAVALNKPAPAMPEQAVVPGEFTAPRLYVSDVTIETACRACAGPAARHVDGVR